uniref:RLR CTR domain-containing protein n=1 Tax=Strongyloides venezuelensis TaxID=75913 RepID=A0A0K0FN25_STRVS
MAFESDFILDINDLPMSHFYTYKYEIIEYFMLPNSDEWLRKLVSKARTEHDIPEITKICTKGRFHTCKKYYEMYDPHYDKEFIMNALKVLPVDIKNNALLKDIPKFSLNLYSQLFLKKYDNRVFEKILICTKWHDIYERFNSNSKYKVFCEKIKKELDKYPGCADYLGCLFLRELPFIDYFKNIENNWYYDLRVAYAESDLNRAILMQFNPDFFPFLKGIKMKREAEEKKRRRLLGESLQIDNIKLPDVPETLRIQSKYLDYLPEASKKAVGTLQPLKSYQLELVSSVDNNTINHILWIPEKAGKISIISHIANNHFQLHCKEQQLTRILLLVPHFKYVHDYKNYLRGLCSDLLNVDGIADYERNFTNINSILAHDFVVMSGQMFLDLIKVNNPDYKLYLQDFSLIFMDHCEISLEGHPYCSFIKFYNENNNKKPKLIGITESLGRHLENNEDNSMNALGDLCYNFSASKIDIVKNNAEDFYKDVSKGFQEIVICLSTPNFFIQIINRESYTIEKEISNVLSELLSDDNFKELKFPGIEDTGTYYEYCDSVIQIIQQQSDENIKKSLLSAIDFLCCLSFTLSIHNVIPTEYSFENCVSTLRRWSQNCDESQLLSKKLLESYNRILQSRNDPKYKTILDEKKLSLVRLEHIIKQSIKKNFKSKIFIRVSNEIVALTLDRWLSNNDFMEKYNCIHTYVINVSDQDPQNEEEDTIYHDRIRKFKDGKINILISTDVCQNDIDISTLDCFISYNCPITYTKYIGNFKTTDGYPKNMALIVTEGLLELDDQKLFEKDRMTNCIVRRLRKMSDYEFQSFIEERKKCNNIRNKNYVEVIKEYCNKNENAVYDISCSSCMTYLCSSKDVGIFENITNIIVTPDIWSKVTYITDKHYKYTKAFMRVGLVCCKVCKKDNAVDDINENNTLGTIIKLRQGFVIKLVPKNLFFTDTVTKEQHYMRGLNAIETNLSLGNEISEDDFLEYCQESMCRDPEMHLLFMKKMSNYISACRSSMYHKDI